MLPPVHKATPICIWWSSEFPATYSTIHDYITIVSLAISVANQDFIEPWICAKSIPVHIHGSSVYRKEKKKFVGELVVVVHKKSFQIHVYT